jgi:predicted membrane protein
MEDSHWEHKKWKKRKSSRLKKIVFGLVVVLTGILIIGFNAGFLPEDLKHIFISWQMLLIAIGFINLFDWRSIIPGVIMILIGGFFMVPDLYRSNIDFVHLIWPSLIILLGVLIIFSGFFKKKRHQERPLKPPRFGTTTFDTDALDEVNIFSGNKQIINSQNFKGGRLTNIFGGSEIDLTHAALSDGKNYLDVVCIFGGVSLIVPSDWSVVLNIKPFMGGFSDQRKYVKTNGDNSNKVLIITGIAILGGGEIKST